MQNSFVFFVYPQGMLASSNHGSLGGQRYYSKDHSDVLSMSSKVCCGFLESTHLTLVENCGCEGQSLFPLLGLIVQELEMSFISGI